MAEDSGASEPGGSEPPSPADPESTFQLIVRARTGDQSAVDALFARHLAPLRRLGQRPAAPLEPRSGRYRRPCPGDPAPDVQEDRRLRAAAGWGASGLPAAGRDRLEINSDASPLEAAIGAEAVERYEQALGRLTPDEREAIIARIELGCSYAEMAEALGKPTPDAARKAASRALVRLAQEMERSPAESASRQSG